MLWFTRLTTKINGVSLCEMIHEKWPTHQSNLKTASKLKKLIDWTQTEERIYDSYDPIANSLCLDLCIFIFRTIFVPFLATFSSKKALAISPNK